jgi:transposase InsO family protein
VHVAIDDCTRLGYAEVLADETKERTAGFLERAVRYFERRGIRIGRIMTNNGSAYRSRVFAAVLARHQLRHLRTRPYTPRTNGKAERFIRTLLASGPTPKPIAPAWRAPMPCRTILATTTLLALTWGSTD